MNLAISTNLAIFLAGFSVYCYFTRMEDDEFRWFGTTLHGRDITFPDDTVWRLEDSLAEKAQFPEQGPPEASAVFNCEQ